MALLRKSRPQYSKSSACERSLRLLWGKAREYFNFRKSNITLVKVPREQRYVLTYKAIYAVSDDDIGHVPIPTGGHSMKINKKDIPKSNLTVYWSLFLVPRKFCA